MSLSSKQTPQPKADNLRLSNESTRKTKPIPINFPSDISHLPLVSIIYVFATKVNAIIEMFGIF